MPVYEVRYICPLTEQQKDRLAVAITRAHSNKFTTMRSFVNVRFVDASGWETYVGGNRQHSNMIVGQVGSGPSRTQDMWTALGTEMSDAWKEIVLDVGTPNSELRAVLMVGELLGGLEAGMKIPAAGKDMEWLAPYWPDIKRRAEAGEWEMVQNMEDIKDRGLLKRAGLES